MNESYSTGEALRKLAAKFLETEDDDIPIEVYATPREISKETLKMFFNFIEKEEKRCLQ
jgi:hypothetical protein